MPMPTEVKHRSCFFEVKATGVSTTDDGQEFGEIEAYGSVFDVIDEGDGRVRDIVRPGAFKRTIQSSKSRVSSGKANYLAAMLWQHNPDFPIGGWYDLSEDDHGLKCKGRILLSIQHGIECYNLIKAGVIDQFSIGYDIPNGGMHWDEKESNVRNLTELRLWEVSPVTFAMNQDALLIGVKSMEHKAITGNTGGAIGPRDETWDGSKAQKQIWEVAEKEDGSISSSIAKKYFMVCDGDGSKKGDYSYPFWFVGDSPHICVGAVKAIADAIQGARGANAPSGLKGKVETLYKRINRKYPNDPELTPPWSDDGKARGNRHMQTKTFDEHYADEMCEDLLEDWQDRLLCAFTCAVLDACKIGDTIETDVQDALAGLSKQVMAWVAQAQQYNLSDYLEENSATYSSADSLMQNGSSSSNSYYGYMSSNLPRSVKLRLKAGRAISAANQASIGDHVRAVKAMAMKAKADMKDHVAAMHDAVDTMAGNDDGKSADGHSTKAGRAISTTNANQLHDMADKAMDIMQEHTKSVTSAADDFANTMQGAESPAYGDGEGEADDDQQEGRGKSQRSPYARTPAAQQRPHKSTALEDVEIPASWIEDIKLRKAV